MGGVSLPHIEAVRPSQSTKLILVIAAGIAAGHILVTRGVLNRLKQQTQAAARSEMFRIWGLGAYYQRSQCIQHCNSDETKNPRP